MHPCFPAPAATWAAAVMFEAMQMRLVMLNAQPALMGPRCRCRTPALSFLSCCGPGQPALHASIIITYRAKEFFAVELEGCVAFSMRVV